MDLFEQGARCLLINAFDNDGISLATHDAPSTGILRAMLNLSFSCFSPDAFGQFSLPLTSRTCLQFPRNSNPLQVHSRCPARP